MFLEKTSYFNLTVFASMTSIFFSYCQTTTSLDTNNLSLESSPYLLQHAQNPVFWQRWKKGAYKEMNTTDKLLIISLGYSSCHWCHVMEKETFEDINVAKEMNENFISIKVDREENPDVDNIYMTAVQMMTGSGGWPLNVICLPDGRPIYGGTYHSKKQWLEILTKVQQLYTTNKDKLIAYADKIEKGIQQVNSIEISTKTNNFSPKLLEKEITLWEKKWDENHGGEKQNQKFITPVKFNYIQQFQALTDSPKVTIYLKNSLTTIANSGVYDHVEGGFFRYSIDSSWNIPHFEKMLYDNAQVLGLYSNAFKQFQNPLFKERVYQTFSFLKSRMFNKDGGYYSAIDADNKDGEGQYYLFTKEAIQEIVQEDFDLFIDYYRIDLNAPFEEQYFLLKKNIINSVFTEKHKTTIAELDQKNKVWLKKLKTKMEKRDFPTIDTKIITSWNAMLVIGLSNAYEAFNDDIFIEEAKSLYGFLKSNCYKKTKFFHTFQNKKTKIEGFLEDYAFMTKAALSLYKNTQEISYLNDAQEYTKTIQLKFKDGSSPFFTFTEEPTLISKIISLDDSVIPSSNAIMAENLLTIGHLTGIDVYLEQSKLMLQSMFSYFEGGRSSDYTYWAKLFTKYAYPYYEVIIVGPNALFMKAEFQKHYLPNVLFQSSNIGSKLPLLKDRFFKGETYIYVCQNKVCLRPVETIKEAIDQIKSLENLQSSQKTVIPFFNSIPIKN